MDFKKKKCSAERSAYPAKTSSFHCWGIAEFTAYKGNSKSPHFRREWGNKDLAVTMFRRGGCMYVFAPSSIRISDLCEVVRIQYRNKVEVAKFYEECSGTSRKERQVFAAVRFGRSLPQEFRLRMALTIPYSVFVLLNQTKNGIWKRFNESLMWAIVSCHFVVLFFCVICCLCSLYCWSARSGKIEPYCHWRWLMGAPL